MEKTKKRRKDTPEKSVRNKKRSKIELNDQENAATNTLYGRENEITLLEKLLHEGINNQRPASIFVSGPPGTGKTLAVKTISQNMMSCHSIQSIYINCVCENTERDILVAVKDRLCKSKERFPGRKLHEAVHKLFTEMSSHVIVVLDEMDYIRPKDRSFLCSVFCWPSLYEKVSVIGIANTLDMTKLPKHKLKRVPELIIFAPYTEAQLELILSKNLETGNNEGAIELCARKIAAMTGDARKAVQVARQSLTVDSTCKSTSCRNILGTLSSVYGSPLLQARIPLQQKILLAVMLRLAGDKSCANIDRGCLQSAYETVCERLSIPALEVNEIHSALLLLESQSFLESKPTSYHLLVDNEAAKKVIADTTLISQINTVALSSNQL